jgi:hypothetical protein
VICTKRNTVLSLAAPNHLREAHRQHFGWGLHNYQEQSTREDYIASVVRTIFGGRGPEGVVGEIAEYPSSDPELETRARDRRDRNHLLPQVVSDIEH